MNKRVGLYTGLLGLVGLAACSTSGEQAPRASSLTMKLDGKGERLQLTASAREGYTAEYPNPSRIAHMTVRVRSTGAIVSRCTNKAGARVVCGDTPFYTQVLKIRSGVLVQVFDVYGEPCGEQEFPEGGGTYDAPDPAPAASDCEGAAGGQTVPDGGAWSDGGTSDGEHGSSSGGSDDDDDDNDDDDDDDDDGEDDGEQGGSRTDGTGDRAEHDDDDGPDDDELDCTCRERTGTGARDGGAGDGGAGGTCAGDSAEAQRDAFCAGVNGWLREHGFTPIDCATLDQNGYDKTPKPPPGSKGKCEDVWKPVFKPVTAWLKGCKSKDLKTRATHWHEVVRWQLLSQGACKSSPIVLDLDGDGLHLTNPDTGVDFDLLGGGERVRASWTTGGGDAFLAFDRNRNGSIDGAAELFGNATASREFRDGFEALSELDDNGDGLVDARDAAFGELLVWRDQDHDGKSASRELTSLREAGVRRLFLGAARTSGPTSLDANGNGVPLIAGFERSDGTIGVMADAFLRFRIR